MRRLIRNSLIPEDMGLAPGYVDSTVVSGQSNMTHKGAEDLNRWTVANEWAVAYRKYSRARVADEERERSAGLQIRLGGLAPTAATQMRPQQEPSTQEVLAGFVERVTFHNSENGFCVLRAKARGHRDLVTVIGHAATISAGEWITASGEWVNDHTHGQQFKARFMRTSAPTSIDGIEKYLGSGMIRGIGPVYAKKLVRAFGEKVFDTIEAEPERLREVTGIGLVRAKRITDAWAEQKIIREIMVFLHSNGVGTARAVRIFKTYGADAVQVMTEKGYPWHRFQDCRRDRDEARHRKDRHDPVAGRDFLRADRGHGRGTLRAPNG